MQTDHKFYALIALGFVLIFLFRIWQIGGLSAQLASKDDLTEASVVRQNLAMRSGELLPSPQAELLSGILLGEKSNLPKSFTQALQNTSTIHIVVVSGQNLSLVAGFVLSLASLLGRKKTLVLASFTVLLYSWLTGFQVPVLRAALMVELGFAAQIMGKNRESVWILLLTGAAMLIFNPNWLLSISFQLSFLATLAVLSLAPELIKVLKFIPEILKEDLGVSLSAQLLTWPIIAANFHQFSVLGVLVNALVLWTVSFVMISGAVSILLSFIIFSLGEIFSIIPNILLTYFIYIINFFSNISFSNIKFPDMSLAVWVGYYLVITSVFIFLKKFNSKDQDVINLS